jgi:adenosylhomocysteine nucleosidase
MRILVTFAVEAEFAPWRALRAFRKVRVNPDHWSGGVEVNEAQIGGCTVWVFLTGIGIKSFDFAVASCLRAAGLSLVMSSGLAGSLKPEYRPEEIVVPKRVGTLRDASGIALPPRLVSLGESRGGKIIEVLLTSDRIIGTQEEKNRLAIFGEAIDMESFHVATEFSVEGIPVAIIRAISDGSGEDLPVDFTKCLTPEGHIRSGALLRELWGHPAKIPELIRFGRQSRSSARKLSSFLDGFILTLTTDILDHESRQVAAT